MIFGSAGASPSRLIPAEGFSIMTVSPVLVRWGLRATNFVSP